MSVWRRAHESAGTVCRFVEQPDVANPRQLRDTICTTTLVRDWKRQSRRQEATVLLPPDNSRFQPSLGEAGSRKYIHSARMCVRGSSITLMQGLGLVPSAPNFRSLDESLGSEFGVYKPDGGFRVHGLRVSVWECWVLVLGCRSIQRLRVLRLPGV